MSTSLAYHTQGIIGFQHQSYEFSGGVAIQRLIRKEFRCPRCFHSAVKTYPIRTRRIQGLPYGTKTTFFELDIHRIYCPKCSEATVEEIPFISHPKARITTAFERTIIELRPEMTISAISKHFNLDWRVIKGVEKRYLKRKFKHVKLKKVKYIGIDEIAVGHDSEGKTAYLTIVRDLDSGSVLHVDRGKDGEALGGFLKRLRRSKAEIELVAMDMGRAFISWVEKYLPKANIVFDHFHVIKLMNEKIDKARRRITATLDDKEKEVLKKQRFTLLHNEEDLDEEAAEHLEEIKNTFQELADLHMMKEYLRSIYRVATSEWSAEIALRFWIKTAKGMKSDLLQKMVGTMEKHWKGILGFWRFGGATNAAMEGFNNKVRTMLRQEVTQVNELLHQMENFSGVMIGATNFAANLDAAVLRRFTFKLEFDYLDKSGKILFFERMFQTRLNDMEKIRLEMIPNLTPGDFRTVRQSLFYLGGDISNSERLAALERESLAKGQNRFAQKMKIGFNNE